VAVPDQHQRHDDEDPPEEFPVYLTSEDRGYQRLVFGRWGRLVDFAIMQQLFLGEDWVDVVRFDCRHGSFHVHRFTRWGLRSRDKLGDLRDLEAKYDMAVEDIAANWEENRRRYLDG
jgi:hypothetical protein